MVLKLCVFKNIKHIQELELLPLRLFKSRALVKPLSMFEAKRCLKDFLRLVQIALNSLHSNGYAHLDIRMPNVCFTLDGTTEKHIAVLIDLDRAQEANLDVTGYYKDTKSDCVAEELDWIQLGIMAKTVMNNTGENFVSSLIKHGMCYNI